MSQSENNLRGGWRKLQNKELYRNGENCKMRKFIVNIMRTIIQ
jgi:hypothetical protein